MARIKKYAPEQKLSSYQTFIVDENPNSDYFRITEFNDTFTGGKNGFLIEGSEYLKESTEIKIDILDVNGDPIYYEPGNGIPEYYEGISKLIAVYIYEDTPIGLGKITILGELKEYDDNGVKRTIPENWKGAYNVKWERTFQINKNLANEDRVRFYRRPVVNITEINKPIFNNNSTVLTKSGSANGIPLVPIENTKLANFSLPTSYRITTADDNFWTGSIAGQTITFGDINYSATIDEVISDTEIVVSPPYTQTNLVKPFTNKDYSVSFNYLEGVTDLATALTGSFAKINITDMKTFVGDAARVKVFRRSQSNLTDYEFVQEIQLESNELLRDIETTTANEENYGTFTEDILSQYWITSSNDFTTEFNRSFLYNSAKLNSTTGNYFITSQSFSVQSGVEYTLDFNVKKGSANGTHFLKAFLSGSLNGTAKSQTIVNIPSSTAILQKQNFNQNIVADEFDSAKLYFEVEGDDWYINNVSLKASQETSFSPDEITFIQQVPKTLQTETFDYRFEFYDINNNYIPVLVEETKTFDGGNLNLFNKSITITPNQLYFTFDSASNPSNPLPPYTIVFDIETSVVTGSVNFTSGAYDEFGDYISASEYIGGQYPGLLYDRETGTPTLHVSDFTGSRDDIFVQYIRFTGEVEGVSDSVVISRVQDGKGGVNFEIRPYRGTIIKNKSDKDLEVQAIRIDGVNEIVLRDGLPQTGFSDAKLRILTSSVDPFTSEISSSYLLLSEATAWGVIQGVTAGTTGSGEIDYNAVFNRDSIDSELTLYLMDGITSESILTSLILTDLQDGLDGGYISFDAEQFGIRPRIERVFTPNIGRVTGSFYLRGTNENPISGTLDIFPSMSVDPETIEPTYYMFYVTNSFDRRISIEVTDFDNNIINSGIPGQNGITFYEAIPTKQLNTKFTYTEDITSSSISTDKTFFAVPDGNPGDDAILVKIDPNPIVLNADQRGRVFNYDKANTEVTVTQGVLPLIFTGSKKPGTFTTASIITTGIEFSTFDEVGGDASMSLSGFSNMNDLTASIEYVLEIHPFFTASFFTQSYFQPINKSLDGAAAINIELEPTVVSIVTEENGGAYNYSSANTTLKVKQGDEYLEYNPLEIPGTFTASFVTTNISVGLVTSSKTETTENDLHDTLNFVSMSNMTSDSASIDYNITVRPFSITNGIVTGSQSIVRKQLFTKQKEGVKARSVSLETTSQTVNFDGDGVVTSPLGSIFLTATPFNVTGSQTYYQFFQDGYAYSTIDVDNTFEIGSGDATSPGNIATWKVEIRDGAADSPVVASAEVTITGIKSGANNYQVFLTNPSPTVGIEVDGTTDFTKTGTQIKAFKGTQELTHVTNYSSPTLDLVGDPIGVLGEFSASVWSTDSYITQPNYPVGNPATVGPISAWTIPQDNPSATIVYKVDIEDGRATYFLSQSISTVFEGATGPGVVFRGPWTGSIEYIYDKDAKRRDAVLWSENGFEPYDTYYATKDSGSSYLVPLNTPPTVGGVLDENYWISLGQEEFFVAAKIAIFEESFVKNTINVGTPPAGNPNAQIAIVGGTDEPYIAIGQIGTQGYAQPGIWLGMSNDGGPVGTSGTMGLLSLKSTPVGGEYNSMEWDGETLTIRGAIRQTSAGVIEPSLRGTWASGTTYYPQDLVQYLGETWSSNTQHTSTNDTNATTGVPGSGPWTIAAGAGKGVNLSATSYVIQYDEFGNNPTPASTITLIASSSNFVNGFYKFTGGGAAFTDETTFTDGLTANTDTATLNVPATYFSTPLSFKVAVAEGDQVEKVSDTITITALKSGADSTPMYMITPLNGTQIKNGSGTIQLQVQESSISGLSNVSSGNIKIYSGSNLITTYAGVTGTDYNPTIAASTIVGTMNLTLKDGAATYDALTLVDVTDGLGGGSFLSPNLKATRNPGYGIYTPTFLSATASFFDTSGTEYTKQVRITPSLSSGTDYMAVGAASGDTEITITANDGDGGSITLGGAAVATKDVVLVATFTDPATSQTTTINETFYIVSDGADGLAAITIVNPNSAHTLPADSSNVVTSYANSGTTIDVYEGTGSLQYDSVGTSPGTWKITPSVSPTSAITVGAFGTSGFAATIGNHSGMSNSEPTATITYTIDGKRVNGDSFTSETTQTLTKSPAGNDGTSGTSGASGTSGTSGAAGAPGPAGAGVVYRGIWESGTIYYYNAGARQDVVQYNGSYYLCTLTHTSAASGTDGPPGVGSNWDNFGAEFTSVATDVLFSQDVYANRTINVGASGGSPVIALNADSSSNYQNPFISIGQTTSGFLQNGIYFGYTGGNPVLSMVSGSTFFYYESGSIELSDASFVGSGSIIEGSAIRVGRNLDVSTTASNAYNFTVSSEGVVSASQAYVAGTIAASDGTIGNWVIDPIVNGNGGTLRDVDSEIVFEPNIPEIQIYSGSVQRVFIGSSNLTSIAAVNDTFIWSGGEPIITSQTITSNASNRNPVSTTKYTGVSSTVSVTAGTYQFTDVDWPAMTIVEPDAVPAENQSYPNYQPSYAGQYHGGLTVLQQYPVNIAVALYLDVVDTNNGNAVIGSTLLGNQIATGDFGFASGYVAVDGGGFEVSVTGDTEITLSDGSIKLAKDISITDTILAWDEPNNKFSEATLTNIKTREVDRIFKVTAGGLSVKVSDTHGFWLDGGDEIKVQDIIVGETQIYVRDGDSLKFVVVDGVEEIIENTQVYTLSVPPYVNYISNGIISHNLIGGGLVWEEQDLDLANTGASKTITAGSAQTKNITISTTTTAAALRYRLVVSTQSGIAKDVNSFGTITDVWYQQTVDINQTNTGGKEVYFASSPIDSDGISIVKSNNFVELKPAGFQLVTSENIYVKARRKDSLVNTTAADAELFRVEGGISYFTAAANPYTTAIAVAGHIRPESAGWDLGGSTSVLKFKNLNGFDIEDLAVSKSNSGYARLFDNIIIQWVRTTITSSAGQGSGTWPTPFDTIYGAVVAKGNASTVYLGDNNGVNVSYTTTNWYVDFNENGTRTNFIIAIGEKA